MDCTNVCNVCAADATTAICTSFCATSCDSFEVCYLPAKGNPDIDNGNGPDKAKNTSFYTSIPFLAGASGGLVLVFILIGCCCKRKCTKHGPRGLSLGR
jgi:hypothetical protein